MKAKVFTWAVMLLAISIFPNHFVTASVVVLNGLSHIHQVQQGQKISGQIVLRNTTDGPQDVKLYIQDYTFNADGESFFPEPGSHERSNANWLDVNTTFTSLEANEEKTIDYEVTIPEGNEMEGTYWSVVLVEAVEPADPNLLNRGLQVNTIMRYAVQIITNIGDTGSKLLQFANYQVEKNDGQTNLVIYVENAGQRLLIPELKVELYNDNGEKIGVFDGGKKKLYPETAQRFLVPLTAVPKGTYQALVIADSPDADLFGANLTVSLDE